MQESYQMTERLIAEFTENYLERLFYFCLKRKGSSSEAEDLASDITLNIITALDRGQVPEDFSAEENLIHREELSNLSEGAVKLKLFHARKKLKEGMSRAREFGSKSFKPEAVKFTSSGNQPS